MKSIIVLSISVLSFCHFLFMTQLNCKIVLIGLKGFRSPKVPFRCISQQVSQPIRSFGLLRDRYKDTRLLPDPLRLSLPKSKRCSDKLCPSECA